MPITFLKSHFSINKYTLIALNRKPRPEKLATNIYGERLVWALINKSIKYTTAPQLLSEVTASETYFVDGDGH